MGVIYSTAMVSGENLEQPSVVVHETAVVRGRRGVPSHDLRPYSGAPA